jgi:predicted nucleic acid-binding protein
MLNAKNRIHKMKINISIDIIKNEEEVVISQVQTETIYLLFRKRIMKAIVLRKTPSCRI